MKIRTKKIMLSTAIILAAAANYLIVSVDANARTTLSLVNLDTQMEAQADITPGKVYEHQWDAAIAHGHDVFGIPSYSFFAFKEWGEYIPCPESSSESSSTSIGISANLPNGVGGSINASNQESRNQQGSQNRYKVKCHRGGTADCSPVDCY